MNGTFFYIGLGAGLAAACGLRPFMPLLLAGALGSAGVLGVSFARAPFRFVQSDWWLLAVVALLVIAYALQLLLPRAGAGARAPESTVIDPLGAALGGLSYGAGGLVFAGTLAAHGDSWWPGIVAGLLCAGLAERAVAPVLAGARTRLSDRTAREALTLYVDAGALALAALVALLHPLGYLALALLLWLLLRVRARADAKYAGLRVLRR